MKIWNDLGTTKNDKSSGAGQAHVMMKSSSGGVIGGSTHVQLSAIAGLASSHSAPFVRILHEDVIALRHRPESDGSAVVAVEIPEDRAPPDQLKRAHHRRSEYTAHWSGDSLASVAILPIEVDWIELQVWNRFTDVAVFLGTTSVSLRALRRDNPEEQRSDSESKRFLWFPLDSSKEATLLPRSLSSLSVQVSISFHLYDARTQRIQQQISERRRGHVATGPFNGEAEAAHPVVVDPSFQFTQPSSRIEWSSVVAANVRRMFFHGDVDELLTFFGDVAHGDMEREIEEDGEIVVDEDYLKAFRLAQLSTQYIEHCVELLVSRRDQYEEHHRVLRSTRRDRRREHKDLMDQRRRLQKELEEVELLTATYGKLLEQHGHQETSAIGSPREPVQALSSPQRGFRGEVAPSGASSPVRESSDVVSKKPAFLMTWEEREQARKQQKELDKARRIDEEKVRLQNLFKERQKREQFEAGISGLALRRQVRCVIKLQRMVRSFMKKRRSEYSTRRERAATRVQTQLRRYLCRKKWPHFRQELQHHREHRLMEVADRESAARGERDRELVRQQQRLSATQTTELISNNDESDEDLGDLVRAVDLVATWKKLKRIFTLACQKGARSTSLFAKLDSRADGIVDRAEFRTGIRYFGIRIDRKMTRAIIALVRAKCESPTKPLTMTVAQFTRGFDLPTATQETPVDRRTKLPPVDDSSSNVKAADHIREATRSSLGEEFGDDDDCEDDEDRSTSVIIEEVANAVSSLRRRVLEAAADHLNALNKSTDDYFAFREALTHVFQEFDVDGNGELDVEELVDCMASISFRVTRENVAILRECFVSDPTASDSISISEFISFALAGAHSLSSATQRPVEEELGILGFKLRDAILERIKLARKHTDSIEDAVRWVFKNAYRSRHQLRCARRDFVRVLASLRLGFTPAQLSRLVLRLDQDGDNTISFDELLSWLRLRVSDTKAANVATNSTIGRHLKTELDMASVLRRILRELAGLDSGSFSRKQSLERAVELFKRIDDNHSKKINASELASFFYSVDINELRSVAESGEQNETLVSDPTRLAEEIVMLIDLNGNGVITLEEWTGLLLGEQQSTNTVNERSRAERYAIVEGIRLAMHAAFSDESALLGWFQSIPGAILVDKTRNTGTNESKVRAREFKNAMRTKFPFISAKDVDEAMKLLDADGSGWITEKEILQWQFPTRDIEELRVVIARVWASERESTRLKGLPEDLIVDALYQRFDRDGNGLIARNELRAGFQSFRVALNNEEAENVIQEFDTDRDGFWNKADFTACVRQLTPARVEKKVAEAERRLLSGSNDDDGYNSPDADHHNHEEQRDAEEDSDAYSNEDDKYAPSSSDSYSLGELSPLAMSPPRFTQSRHPAAGPVEYSEDFDEDA